MNTSSLENSESPSSQTNRVRAEQNRISKYLTIPTLPQKPKAKQQTGARIVTSYEFLAELREKEDKQKRKKDNGN